MSDVEDILKVHSPEVQQTVAALREFIKNAFPTLEEEAKRGWGSLVYKEGEVVCAISPHKDHVNVGFYKGISLSDPENLLEGTGKNLRHLKVRNAESIPTESLTRFIQEAYQLRNA